MNGHNVLQSSEKVVKTLLDARTSLDIVIARRNLSKTDVTKVASKTDDVTSQLSNGVLTSADVTSDAISPTLVFDDVFNMAETCNSDVTVVMQSERSKRYEQVLNGGESNCDHATPHLGPTFVL